MEAVIIILVRILETLFVIGIIGSAVVILMSGIEDVETILEPDELQPGVVSRD